MYLHLAFILWYPQAPIQYYVGAVVCAVEEEVETSTLFVGEWGGGKCVQDTKKSISLPNVLTFFVAHCRLVTSAQQRSYVSASPATGNKQ